LRPRVAGARILACVLNGRTDESTSSDAAGTTADAGARSLVEATDQIERLASSGPAGAADGAAADAVGAGPEAQAQSLAQGLRRDLLHPGEIDDDHAHLCHAFWQAPDGGGDFVEARRREDGTLIGVIAALSSESIAAALLTAAMRKSLEERSPHAATPSELLDGLERDLASLAGVGDAISALALFYGPSRRVLQVASAGNPEPILLRGEAADIVPVPAGPPLLTARDANPDLAERRTVELVLEPGDRLLFYTEGAIEIAHPERGFLEPSGLAALAREHRSFAGLSFLEHVVDGIRAFGDGEPEDDIVLLSLDVRERVAPEKIPDAAD
jgi:serine phosphatase RsbU (regulator of sigma subunit)